ARRRPIRWSRGRPRPVATAPAAPRPRRPRRSGYRGGGGPWFEEFYRLRTTTGPGRNLSRWLLSKRWFALVHEPPKGVPRPTGPWSICSPAPAGRAAGSRGSPDFSVTV